MYTPEHVYMSSASQMQAQEFFCGMAAASPVIPSQRYNTKRLGEQRGSKTLSVRTNELATKTKSSSLLFQAATL